MNLLPIIFFPFIIIPFIALLFVVAPLIIGFLVYNDARKRGVASPGMWAIVAMLVPFYIGLLLYLLIGSTQTNSGDRP
ncbi:MAG: hypothetical protein FD133_1753 [Erysipelotrichaceae bacterium]|nr:MAG: hypothetical protein FD179_495 [Erysipelotrichaceae bacterium]TXT16594.1 MAG: hypothetical protein FD133_1753 [Erysipelotrichaceae bacterium]